MDLFSGRRVPDPQQQAAVKHWARESLGASPDAVLIVKELRCTEPGCPPLETVILFATESGTQQYKIHKPLMDVHQDDVSAVINGSAHHPHEGNPE